MPKKTKGAAGGMPKGCRPMTGGCNHPVFCSKKTWKPRGNVVQNLCCKSKYCAGKK